MANPMAVGYWLGVGGALAAAGAIGASLTQTAAFVAGFAAAVLAWAFFMALAVRWGKQIITPALFRIVTFVCGATLIVFGVGLAARILEFV
jgi:threonine/homoserine/homoserine lactone efflux protein